MMCACLCKCVGGGKGRREGEKRRDIQVTDENEENY